MLVFLLVSGRKLVLLERTTGSIFFNNLCLFIYLFLFLFLFICFIYLFLFIYFYLFVLFVDQTTSSHTPLFIFFMSITEVSSVSINLTRSNNFA